MACWVTWLFEEKNSDFVIGLNHCTIPSKLPHKKTKIFEMQLSLLFRRNL